MIEAFFRNLSPQTADEIYNRLLNPFRRMRQHKKGAEPSSPTGRVDPGRLSHIMILEIRLVLMGF